MKVGRVRTFLRHAVYMAEAIWKLPKLLRLASAIAERLNVMPTKAELPGIIAQSSAAHRAVKAERDALKTQAANDQTVIATLQQENATLRDELSAAKSAGDSIDQSVIDALKEIN